MSPSRRGWSGAASAAALAGTTEPPASLFDVALLDLDGVVYLGSQVVPHAADALAAARARGLRPAYVTNNASRLPEEVAERLNDLGVTAQPEQIVTSAHAASRLLADDLEPAAPVLVTGTAALARAVTDAGLRVVTGASDRPHAVVVGFDPTMDYPRLAEAALAIRSGARFVATNRDATFPTDRGPLPGMGSFVALLVTATGTEPVVAGKPEPALFAESVDRSSADHPVMVGDRLDTDIAGGRRAGIATMLVLTGVTDLLTVAQAAPECRPSLLAADLRGLNEPHPAAHDGRCGSATATYDEGNATVRLIESEDEAHSIRAVVTAAWRAVDDGLPVLGIDLKGETARTVQ